MSQAPKAHKKPHILNIHNHERIDNYFWMNERENPEVLKYINDENDYFESAMLPMVNSQEKLFQEMKSRIPLDDESVPVFENGYYYTNRIRKGNDYPEIFRQQELGGQEEMILDVQKMAQGFDYYNIGNVSISPDNKYVAYALDTVSRRQYNIHIKEIGTGDVFDYHISNTSGSIEWHPDGTGLYYVCKDPQTLRPHALFFHTLRGPGNDEEIFKEVDETFYLDIATTSSKDFLLLNSHSTLTSEVQVIDFDTHTLSSWGRERSHEYHLDHLDEQFYVLSNRDGNKNFALFTASTPKDWSEIIPHNDEILIEDFDIFESSVAVIERHQGVRRLRILDRHTLKSKNVLFEEEEEYRISLSSNPEPDASFVRISYISLTTPTSVIDVDLRTLEKKLRKETPVLEKSFHKDNYIADRYWVQTTDGTQVPYSLVYNHNTILNENTPVLVYAYGSYGITVDVSFSPSRLSLLDRGFVFVIAHIRGGEYLGRDWYEQGKLMNKKNTFTDFIDVTRDLHRRNISSPEHTYAMGGSAGGLLMGAVANMAPEIYCGMVAAVPFVDVVTTMLDDSIPLTTGEYDEWGNPHSKDFYEYMLSYSPYDNVNNLNYPNMFITTGLHDSQVQYWEPLKWVAKLREYSRGDAEILLHTNMKTGHGYGSKRFDSLLDTARDYTWILNQENQAK